MIKKKQSTVNRGLFGAQKNQVETILDMLEMDPDRNWYPEYHMTSASAFRGLSYVQTWEKCIQTQLYDFLLGDQSLIQFRVDSFQPLKVGYNYYECPHMCISYKDYIEKETGLTLDDIGYELISDYEQYVIECPLKDAVTPLRYDYSPEFYKEGRHPASHIHFGHANQIRVGTKKKLVKPLSFLLFVIRQCYPNKWTELTTNPNATAWCRNIRESLDDVEKEYWGPKDQYEMILI